MAEDQAFKFKLPSTTCYATGNASAKCKIEHSRGTTQIEGDDADRVYELLNNTGATLHNVNDGWRLAVESVSCHYFTAIAEWKCDYLNAPSAALGY